MIGNGYHDPRIIPVGSELPPMESRPERLCKPTHGKASEPKGKAGKRPAGERFHVLNNFVDFTLAELSRAEIAVWLILYRDTRGGTARTGIEARDNSTLADFTASYIRRRTDIKPRTRINLEQCRTRLMDFFGPNRSLLSIPPGDADNWLLWLKERYADGTPGRAIKRAKQFFRAAVRSRLIPSNPFDDVKPPSMVNESRKQFIDRPIIDRVLQACSNGA
jgi:hypothetical protein